MSQKTYVRVSVERRDVDDPSDHGQRIECSEVISDDEVRDMQIPVFAILNLMTRRCIDQIIEAMRRPKTAPAPTE